MKELVEYIAKSIVNSPDAVVVTEEQTEQGITLKLQVADEDKGLWLRDDGKNVPIALIPEGCATPCDECPYLGAWSAFVDSLCALDVGSDNH
jgi:hypothetical protein